MSAFLGIDTSNYTTSAAIYDADSDRLTTASRLLPVEKGSVGLRQSEAVFHHTQALPGQIAGVTESLQQPIRAIGVSVSPRDAAGSYMPCFTVGKGAAHSIGSVIKAPVWEFSHQAGHVAAAIYGSGRRDLFHRDFLAVHCSGGTTDALLVSPCPEKVFSIINAASSLDLKAGQVIDRVGQMLSLPFPAGPSLDALARRGTSPRKPHPAMKGADCCLSGIVNQCEKMLHKDGDSPSDIACFCIRSVEAAVREMVQKLLEEHPSLPVLFAGGVMANSMIREDFSAEFGAAFAPPNLSSDNAGGIAVLAAICEGVSL